MPTAVPLEAITAADFAPHLGSTFDVSLLDMPPVGAETPALILLEVTPLGRGDSNSAAPCHPFSLLFAGPKSPSLPQQIYRLEHAALGSLEIFLVPVGETPQQREYQAIFS